MFTNCRIRYLSNRIDNISHSMFLTQNSSAIWNKQLAKCNTNDFIIWLRTLKLDHSIFAYHYLVIENIAYRGWHRNVYRRQLSIINILNDMMIKWSNHIFDIQCSESDNEITDRENCGMANNFAIEFLISWMNVPFHMMYRIARNVIA